MDTDHIEAVIENVPSIRPSIKEMMKRELQFRSNNSEFFTE
jgi:hypothetical protein